MREKGEETMREQRGGKDERKKGRKCERKKWKQI